MKNATMAQLYWALEVLFVASFVCTVSSADDHKDLLISSLFNGYNQYVSPFVQRQNASDAQNNMDVAIRLSSVTVSSVNEQDFTVKVLVTVNYRWIDPHFRWDPSAYGNISRIAIKSVAVWQPDLYPCECEEVTVLTPDSMSALIRHDGLVIQDTNLAITYNCPMNFDAFPFDRQSCQICFALDGFSGSNVNLKDTPPDERKLSTNSEWDFVSNLTIDENKTELDGLTTDTVTYRFILARRSFFWVFLIVVPSCLICIVAQFGIFFSYAEIIVENAVSIGLNTMTSLMLAVTVLADFLAKTNNLPGLGWFVLMDIVIVCVSVISILIIDHSRSFAIEWMRKRKKENKCIRLLLSNNTYRVTRVVLFLISIVALSLNVILNWSISHNVEILQIRS